MLLLRREDLIDRLFDFGWDRYFLRVEVAKPQLWGLSIRNFACVLAQDQIKLFVYVFFLRAQTLENARSIASR